MLKKIYLDGFRHFKNFTFEPCQHMTLLSGLNGTGKTTLVEVISRLQLFLVNSLPVTSLCQSIDIPLWELKERGDFTSTLGFCIENDGSVYSYEIEIKHNFRDAVCRVEKESLKIDNTITFSSMHGNADVVTDDEKDFHYPVDWTFTGLMIAKRNSSKIRTFLKIVSDRIFSVSINPFSISSLYYTDEHILNIDGSNFSAWYDYLLGTQPDIIATTYNEIKSFIPGFKRFILGKEGKSTSLIADIYIDINQSYQLSFENLSHGQKVLCLLHFLIRICPVNSTVIIDEFENFLSPVELQPLYDAAQDAFEEKDVQFIFVSHHQKTMNWFQDSAWVLSFSGNPSFVRIKKFLPSEDISIEELLMTNVDE